MEVIDRIDEESVRKISKIKGVPKWMENFRVKSYKKFAELKNPNFGPQLSIDFNLINYYKKMSDKVYDDWAKVDCSIKDTFDKIVLIDSEKRYIYCV